MCSCTTPPAPSRGCPARRAGATRSPTRGISSSRPWASSPPATRICCARFAGCWRPWPGTRAPGASSPPWCMIPRIGLPTALSGVSVKFNGLPAAVYYISPAQLNVQAPAGLAGAVSVTATNNGATSAAFNVTAAQNAPSLFNYAAGSSVYPAAVHADGVLIGNPAVTVGARMAVPSETIILFVNGLAAAPSGTLIGAPIPYPNPVTVTIGSVDAPVGYAGLVSPGQYQLNVKVPAALAPGDHPIVVSTAGVTSPAGITLPVGQ